MNESAVPFRHSLTDRVSSEVRAEVARQKMTHRRLGELLDLSQSSVTKRLNGVIAFDLAELDRVADVLGVPVDQFLAAPMPAASGVA